MKKDNASLSGVRALYCESRTQRAQLGFPTLCLHHRLNACIRASVYTSDSKTYLGKLWDLREEHRVREI